MTPNQFTKNIKTITCDNTKAGIVAALQLPAGKRPDPKLLELSKWFNGLSESDAQAVKEVIDMAAEQSTYNFLLALDGLLAVSSESDEVKLELYLRSRTENIHLNPADGEELSRLFKDC